MKSEGVMRVHPEKNIEIFLCLRIDNFRTFELRISSDHIITFNEVLQAMNRSAD